EFEQAAAAAALADIAAFDAMTDRKARALAWLPLDDSLGARARALIARDPVGWMLRGVDRSFELWTGDRPAPGGAQGGTALAMAIAQLVVVIIGLFGAVRLWRVDRLVGPIIALVIAYVWLTSVPFQTEGRYAMPARAALLIGVAAMFDAGRRSASTRGLALERRAGP
ncbi:MAG: hypothetical protein M3R54_06140, partial [Chloroflexota bacterium]|nr:hypothetical protein [Chloroflexota bacterium]